MTIADGIIQKRIDEGTEARRRRSTLAQFWPLSRPGVLLLSGFLGRRAILLLPGACVGALPEALLVALIVFALYVAWERLGAYLGESRLED